MKMTRKAWEEVREEKFTVIAFDENDRRVSTFSGLNMLEAFNEVLKVQGMNRTVLVVRQSHIDARKEDRSCIRWEKESFADLFKLMNPFQGLGQ